MPRMAPEAPRDWLAAHAETLDADATQAARVVPRPAEAGLFRLGVPRESGVEGGIADAIEAIARVAAHSLAAAFTFWGQRAFIEYPLQSPNAALRERWLPSLLDGTRSGATGLSNAMKFLGGIEALAIHARARPDDEGWVLQKPHTATTAELAETVTDLLAMPRFRLQSREAVQDAVEGVADA
jgi:hypothetical protein